MLAETPTPYTSDISHYLAHAQILNGELSSETKNILQKLKDDRIKYHQFRDIQVSEVAPPTSEHYISEIPKNSFQPEGVIGAVSLELGKLFNYRETSKFILYDIYPTKGFEFSRSFVNSKKMLSFHSDGSAQPQLSPDFVILYCVRNDPEAVNLVVDLDTLIEHLPSETVDWLMKPLFKHLVRQEPELYETKPILYKEEQHIIVKYDEDNTFAVNKKAKLAMDCLNGKLRDLAFTIENFPNSLIVLNNKRCLHARSSFSPKYDGKDRWIKCAFVTNKTIKNGSIITLPT